MLTSELPKAVEPQFLMAIIHFSSLMWRGLSADLMVVPAGGLLEALQTWDGDLGTCGRVSWGLGFYGLSQVNTVLQPRWEMWQHRWSSLDISCPYVQHCVPGVFSKRHRESDCLDTVPQLQ